MAPASYTALALPDGDPEWDVPGPLVMLVERTPRANAAPGDVRRIRYFSPEEAIACAKALADAAFRLGLKEARVLEEQG